MKIRARVREDIEIGTTIYVHAYREVLPNGNKIVFNGTKASLRGEVITVVPVENLKGYYSYEGWYFHKDWLIFPNETPSITDDKVIEESDY